MGNLRRQCIFSNKCNKNEAVLTNSLLFWWLMHILVYEHLRNGRFVHDQLIHSGCKFDVFEGTGLVDMYAKCGSIEDAWRVFNKMPSQDVITWNTMILGYVKCGKGQKALEIFRQMQQEHACNQTLFLLWACWMHVPVWLWLKSGQACSWADHSKWLWVRCLYGD